MMSNQQVDQMEDELWKAQSSIEQACKLSCGEPQDTQGKREVWAAMQRALAHLDTAIHGAYLFRPEEERMMNEQQLEELKAFVHNEMAYANNSYDRACHINRKVDIEFWAGKMEAFAMVENKIKAIIGGEK